MAEPEPPPRQRRPRGRPKTGKAGLPHRARPEVSPSHPHHVTVRMKRGTWNLRAQRCFRPILEAFRGVRRRPGFRVTHFSVQGNHLHLIAEASERRAMSNGLRALLIRIARALNGVMHARGSRFADRYHESVLRTASSVRRCLRYVLENHARHLTKLGKGHLAAPVDRFSSAAWFDGFRPGVALPPAIGDPPVTSPRSSLLSHAWRTLGLLDAFEPPRPTP
ncbi:MAG: transposase [Deltaproteobacteria bacterium]|nr:transposase [Deltaproteobacteria bacterium]